MDGKKIFISYAREDADFTLKLAAELKQAGADVWMDQLNIQAGSRWDTEIEDALNSSEAVLVILTPEAVNSQNVHDEVSIAIDESKTIVPLYLKECRIPFRIRRIQFIDFRNNYDQGLATLCKTLQAGLKSPSGKKNLAEIEDDIVLKTKAAFTHTVQNTDKDLLQDMAEEPVLLEFDSVMYSKKGKAKDESEYGHLYVRSNSLEFKTPTNKKYDRLVINNIVEIKFVSPDEIFAVNEMEVEYVTEGTPSYIYFRRLIWTGGIFNSPTQTMFNQIEHLIRERKLLLYKPG